MNVQRKGILFISEADSFDGSLRDAASLTSDSVIPSTGSLSSKNKIRILMRMGGGVIRMEALTGIALINKNIRRGALIERRALNR